MFEAAVLALVLAAATAFGVARRRTDGRVRATAPAVTVTEQDVLTPADLGTGLGERVTLVQFSTAFCQPCRAARTLLADVERSVDGVRHVEIDAEAHLELVRRLDVRRTPTVLVLDRHGRIVNRAVGVPRKPELLAAVGAAC